MVYDTQITSNNHHWAFFIPTIYPHSIPNLSKNLGSRTQLTGAASPCADLPEVDGTWNRDDWGFSNGEPAVNSNGLWMFVVDIARFCEILLDTSN